MTIIELLAQKGFIEGIDFTFDGVTLTALEKTRNVEQVIHHEATDEQEAWDEVIIVQETYFEQLPEVAALKRECVELSDPAILINEYLAGRQLGEDDSINIDLFLKGGNGWRSETIPAPSIDELYAAIVPAKNKLEQEKVNAEAEKFLADTDFKVLRHIRQKALAVATSLTEEEYLALEQARHDAALRIIRG